MKCFSQITYGGADLPERGTVARVLVEDGAEVAFGQALFVIKPA
jgi:biotin carboxyl carrier protein